MPTDEDVTLEDVIELEKKRNATEEAKNEAETRAASAERLLEEERAAGLELLANEMAKVADVVDPLEILNLRNQVDSLGAELAEAHAALETLRVDYSEAVTRIQELES